MKIKDKVKRELDAQFCKVRWNRKALIAHFGGNPEYAYNQLFDIFNHAEEHYGDTMRKIDHDILRTIWNVGTVIQDPIGFNRPVVKNMLINIPDRPARKSYSFYDAMVELNNNFLCIKDKKALADFISAAFQLRTNPTGENLTSATIENELSNIK